MPRRDTPASSLRLAWPLRAGTYLAYLALATMAIGTAGVIQVHFVLDQPFQPHYAIVPALLALTVGLSLGRVSILRRQLRQKTDQFRAIADLAQEFTYLRDVDGRYQYVSPSCRPLTGCAPEDFYAMPNLMSLLVHPEDRERWAQHLHGVNRVGEPASLDIRLVRRDGTTVWISHVCAPVFDESGRQTGVRSTNLDITSRKTFEAHIERMAYEDKLTGLPNRHALLRDLHARIAAAKAEESGFALLFLDLAWFKHINDTYGHTVGDELLQEVARRLRELCRGLAASISRFGGDEFVLLLPNAAAPEAAAAFAQDILRELERPFALDGREHYLSGSIGIAIYPYDSRDPDMLIRCADSAMYESKRDRQGYIRFYRPAVARNMSAFIGLENRLRKAIKEGQFAVHYQPIVQLGNGETVGLEALARWNDPERGLLMPGEFIAVAEETGLIVSLGEQILEQVCAQMQEWERRGLQVTVALNVTSRQFTDSRFIAELGRIAHRHGVDMRNIELEVIERALLADVQEAARRIEALRALGVRVAIDDFGTGYSSLAYLKNLPIDAVKVDARFTQDITRQPRDQAILRAIVSLCRDLGLELVAEGIETEEQRALLNGMGCHLGQGYLYSGPLPARLVEPRLAELGGVGRRAGRA